MPHPVDVSIIILLTTKPTAFLQPDTIRDYLTGSLECGVIVVNDGSTDQTVSCCREFSDRGIFATGGQLGELWKRV